MRMKGEIKTNAGKVQRRRKIIKYSKLALLIIFLLLLLAYVVVGVIYNNGNFSITLDKNLYYDKNLIVYDNNDYKVFRTELYATSVESFDNISERWLPNDLDEHSGGSHNGENYMAYTFYIENFGTQTSDYWSELVIDDVIRNVDEAVRVRIYKNGIPTTYAKAARNGEPEDGTVAFESDKLIVTDHVENFAPKEKIKYTVVVWLEGRDPDCTDNILGGEIKLHMEFNSEFVKK